MKYEMIDTHTKEIVKSGENGKTLRAAAEKRNLKYGGHRWTVRPVFEKK